MKQQIAVLNTQISILEVHSCIHFRELTDGTRLDFASEETSLLRLVTAVQGVSTLLVDTNKHDRSRRRATQKSSPPVPLASGCVASLHTFLPLTLVISGPMP